MSRGRESKAARQRESARQHGHEHGDGHGHGHGHGGPVVWDPAGAERRRALRYIALGVALIVLGALLWWWGSRSG